MKASPGEFDVVVRIKDPVQAKKEIKALGKLVNLWFEGNIDKAKAFRIVITEHNDDSVSQKDCTERHGANGLVGCSVCGWEMV